MTAAPGDYMAVRGTCQQWLRDERQASSQSTGDSMWDQRAWYPVQCLWWRSRKSQLLAPVRHPREVVWQCHILNTRERPSPEVCMYSNLHGFRFRSIISHSTWQKDCVFACMLSCVDAEEIGCLGFWKGNCLTKWTKSWGNEHPQRKIYLTE